MGLMRKPAFLAAVATCSILALYFALVAGRAMVFITTKDPIAVGLGLALLVLPLIGAWWMVNEWRLGATVQRMASRLEDEGRLPVHDGERDERGHLMEEAQEALFETSRRAVELAPEDWVAWFHVAYAYDAARDRAMARKSLRHAATLFRTASRAGTSA